MKYRFKVIWKEKLYHMPSVWGRKGKLVHGFTFLGKTKTNTTFLEGNQITPIHQDCCFSFFFFFNMQVTESLTGSVWLINVFDSPGVGDTRSVTPAQ